MRFISRTCQHLLELNSWLMSQKGEAELVARIDELAAQLSIDMYDLLIA